MTIILELTDREAASLSALTLRGVAWSWAGATKIGTDARAVYFALADAGITEADVRIKNIKDITGGDALPQWEDKR